MLLEFPLYEWSVVGLSRATGWPHHVAARTISLTCFYLALPALYLLLGRLAVPRPRRLLVLSLILACPVYLFYSRAFLIESMEVMCCAWFLLGFVRTMDERRWTWLLLTIIVGTGAALIKGTTFAVWLLPAAAYGAWMLWRDVRAGSGWRAPLQTVLWGLATIAVAFGALRWWIALTDPFKEAHSSAWIFTSKTLSQGNWGVKDWAARFSPKIWSTLAQRWQEAMMPAWLVITGTVAAAVSGRSVRGWSLGLVAVFFAAQLLFPFAYAYQEYYFYACAVFLLAGFGFVLFGVLDSRLPRWVCALFIALPFGVQLKTYWHGYRVEQQAASEGGFAYTKLLRTVTSKNSVIVVAGADWAPIIPFYSQRKALMIRNGLDVDPAYLTRAFGDLKDEDVCALAVLGPVRSNTAFLEQAAESFNLESTPTCTVPDVDIYFSRPSAESVRVFLHSSPNFPVAVHERPDEPGQSKNTPFAISSSMAKASFVNVSPAPFQGYFVFGVSYADVDGAQVLAAHPDCDLWLRAPEPATRIEFDYGLLVAAYERAGDKTNGIEVFVTGELPDGRQRILYRRVLDPVNNPKDRGLQREVIPYAPRPGEVLHFANRPNQSAAYDWAYWSRIDVR